MLGSCLRLFSFSRAFLLFQLLLLFFSVWKPNSKFPCLVTLVLDSDSPVSSSLISSLGLATQEIYIELFRLTDPQITSILCKKKKEGVNVNIFLDSKCKRDSQIRRLNRLLPVKYDSPFRLMHRKVVVVDRKISWIGSFNFTRTGFYLQKNSMLRIEDESVASFLSNPMSEKYANFSIEGISLQIWKLPPAKEALHTIRCSVREAHSSIQAVLFSCSHPQLVDDLIDAHNRGVEVQIILDQGQSMSTSKKAILRFMKAGIPLFIYRGIQDLHHKFVFIDDNIVFLGSCNWSKSAFSRNRELLAKLNIQNGPLKYKVKELWKNCFSQAVPISIS
ncbi:phospholipase D-like domain-containing protein [Candidatus Similichlamydia epinepheli]|uniref:phospholipase D-like domain-containing protein n=1 Tax=Candidatus Similichlamydia epinepheli TaxID=1903953 RepID=UPI000D3644EF|nr:phospholipase D-like domain-containing protein [Candidatus Similichlamydia epinepheli]